MKRKIDELSLTEACAAVRSAYIESAENSEMDFNYSENFSGQIEILQRKSTDRMKNRAILKRTAAAAIIVTVLGTPVLYTTISANDPIYSFVEDLPGMLTVSCGEAVDYSVRGISWLPEGITACGRSAETDGGMYQYQDADGNIILQYSYWYLQESVTAMSFDVVPNQKELNFHGYAAVFYKQNGVFGSWHLDWYDAASNTMLALEADLGDTISYQDLIRIAESIYQ